MSNMRTLLLGLVLFVLSFSRNGVCCIDCVPSEVNDITFSFLDSADLYSVSQVSRKFNEDVQPALEEKKREIVELYNRRGNAAVYDRVIQRDLQGLKMMINMGAGLESSGRYITSNFYDKIELTPLRRAAEMEDIQMIHVLLKAGADPRKLEEEHITNLLSAISKRLDLAKPVIQGLIEHDLNQEVLLRESLRSSRVSPEVIEYLLGLGVDLSGASGAELLEVAVKYSNLGGVSILIRNHAPISKKAMLLAAKYPRTEILAQLIENGGEVNCKGRCDNRYGDKFTHYGEETPLHCAASSGNYGNVELLLKNHADVSARDSYQATPLHRAIFGGNVRVIQALVDAHSNLAERDSKGWTPHDLLLKSTEFTMVGLGWGGVGVRSYFNPYPHDHWNMDPPFTNEERAVVDGILSSSGSSNN